MADQHSNEGSSAGNVSGESSDSTVELNIKTLDSQIYTFQVNKNMRVSSFKEKIANETTVPVGQQRLIFRGRVLKDDHLLSEYHVENGHTLHLVERQPAQSQPSSGPGTGETTGNDGNRGNDSSAGNPRNRIGQISHSVVLGTFNVGEQGEGVVPDLSRVIGAVLNSIGLGGQTTTVGNSGTQSTTHSNEGSSAGNVSGESSDSTVELNIKTLDSQIYTFQVDKNGLPSPEALSIVLRQAERLLSGHAVAALSHIAGRLEQEGSSSDPTIRGQIQAESMQLGISMQHLGALLLELGRTALTLRMGQSPAESVVNAGPAVYISSSGPNPIMVQLWISDVLLFAAFSFSNQLPVWWFCSSANPMTLGSVGIGNVPRHINIHIHAGQVMRKEHRESTVMVLVLVIQVQQGATSEKCIATAVHHALVCTIPWWCCKFRCAQPGLVSVSQPPSDSVSLSSVMSEGYSRFRNLIGNMQGDNMVSSGQVESTVQSSSGESGAGSDVGNEHSNTLTANLINRVGESDAFISGSTPESEGQKHDPKCDQLSNNDASTGLKDVSASGSSVSCLSGGTVAKPEGVQENALRSGEKHDATEGDKSGDRTVPLGLGLAGLERKRRGRPQKSQVLGGDGGTASASVDQDQQIRTCGQQLLESLASRSSAANSMNANEQLLGQLPSVVGPVMDSRPLGGQGSDDQMDMASVMSQVLQTPALNGLLAGVSEQTGAGSPDVLRNMLQQFTESPQMRNTINQIAQQVDSQDLGNMFAGLGRGQGGGLDLSRMFQQMMPIVSRAIGGGSATSQLFPSAEAVTQPEFNGRRLSRDDKPNEHNVQINLQQVAQGIENLNPPQNVFRSVVENAVQLSGNEGGFEGLVDELCSDEGLANEYIEMLRHELNRRVQGDPGQDN
ncbi:large proline-rich protein bag6 [Quercus suber]|uniref:Large proline-rich protein bag6 n=1 Tax=Quercus suber TaxID=58331 RepID=A0AAW0JQ85_QUESU